MAEGSSIFKPWRLVYSPNKPKLGAFGVETVFPNGHTPYIIKKICSQRQFMILKLKIKLTGKCGMGEYNNLVIPKKNPKTLRSHNIYAKSF